MRVLIVRHGESENNVVTDSLVAEGLAPDTSPWWQELFRRVQSDPPLTAKGEREAERLADFYLPIFAESSRSCRIFTSPFRRCCQTAWPLASRFVESTAASERAGFAGCSQAALLLLHHLLLLLLLHHHHLLLRRRLPRRRQCR